MLIISPFDLIEIFIPGSKFQIRRFAFTVDSPLRCQSLHGSHLFSFAPALIPSVSYTMAASVPEQYQRIYQLVLDNPPEMLWYKLRNLSPFPTSLIEFIYLFHLFLSLTRTFPDLSSLELIVSKNWNCLIRFMRFDVSWSFVWGLCSAILFLAVARQGWCTRMKKLNTWRKRCDWINTTIQFME